MQSFINETRGKVESGRGAEPLDKAGLSAARESDAAAAASGSLLAAPAASDASEYVPAGALCNLPSFLDFRPAAYEQILADKVRAVQATLSENQISETVWSEQMTLCRSSEANYRLRCRFAIQKLPSGSLVYAMFDHGTACIHLEAFPLASEQLCALMPQLLRTLEKIPELVQSLQAVHFLTALSEDTPVVTLVYDDALLEENWMPLAQTLSAQLQISVLGRSKKQLLVCGNPYLQERFTVAGRDLHYRVLENSFSNPNGKVNQACLEWMMEAVRSVDRGTHLDLLELYCGGGNHTCCLAPLFNRVFAVEIDSALCEAADFNLQLNNCENVYVCRAPSEKFCKQLSRTWKCCIHWAQKQGNVMSSKGLGRITS